MSVPGSQSVAHAQPARAALSLTARAVATPRGGLSTLAQDFRARLSNVWLPRLSWSIGRTGRLGLVGIALLGASAVFLFSAHRQVTDEVRQMRVDLHTAQARAVTAPRPETTDSPQSLRNLPERTEVPQLLNVLLKQADAAQLTIDTAKYEISAAKAGGLVRYRLSFPVDGPYPKVRQFLDATLNAMPALAIEDLSITRKAIADPTIEAQIHMTIFTRSAR
jgi:Tfp pilus assembly protein PilO